MSLFLPPYWSKSILSLFKNEILVFVMTKAVSNRQICFIKALLLLCQHGYFFLNFASYGGICPPPRQILLGLNTTTGRNTEREGERVQGVYNDVNYKKNF